MEKRGVERSGKGKEDRAEKSELDEHYPVRVTG
jgi:hypothetical protein